jgi:signal transduction histidine kinase
MKRIFQSRFQVQLLFALIAAVSMAALAVDLVLNAVQHAESFVLADTNRAVDHAIQELRREYALRLRDDSSWPALPERAQDVTLRGISETVLGSYPGVEGGFWEHSQFLGYSYPSHDGATAKMDVPAAERPSIEAVIAGARAHGRSTRLLRGRHDLVVISATSAGQTSVWAMKRLAGEAEPAQRARLLVPAALVSIALLGAAGVLATGIGLRRGIAQIKGGLEGLHRNFVPDLPERRDELGEISAAINQMARTRRKLEEELRREDRARAVGRLVARIAHEMRNPLNSIRLSLQMLSHRQEKNRLKREDFQIVLDEVDRMNRLLSDLLAFQQPRPPRMEARVVGPLLHDSAQLVKPQAEQSGVLVVVNDAAAECAMLDEQYFRQILVNLLLNAIETSESGNTVQVNAGAAGERIAIQVSDHGPGLTPEQLEHLFEPFYTTKSSGHGLGLAVSRELAQSMGGELFYETGAGDGATFVLRLKGANGT